MKNSFFEELLNAQDILDRVAILTIDQPTGYDDELVEAIGERFILESISEQSVAGFASGLAANNFIPIIFNYASFTTRRSYEQILIDSCMQNRKVILIGMGGGYSMAHLGPSHTSFEDIALARLMPNMMVLAPSDFNDIKRNFRKVFADNRSAYIRLSRYGKPALSEDYIHSELGSSSRISIFGGSPPDRTLLVISTGAISINAQAAINELSQEGNSCSAVGLKIIHMHVTILKPLDQNGIYENILLADEILIFEEHSVIGGLGSAILEFINDSDIKIKGNIKIYGVNDCFIHNHGSQADIWRLIGIDTPGIKFAIKKNRLLNWS